MFGLAQGEHIYGFEGTGAQTIFMAGFGGLVLVAALLLRVNLRFWLLAGVLMASALTAAVDETKTGYVQTWIVGVQLRKAEIHLAFGVMLSILMLFQRGFSASSLTFQGVVVLLMGLYAGLLQFVHKDNPMDAVQTVLFYLATVPCLLMIVPQLAKDSEGCLALIRTIMWVSVIWTFCCSVQYVLDPRKLLNLQGRFWGMLANAQQAAVLCAPFAVCAVWLLLNDPKKRTKLLWIALIAINLLFLTWTGSRTGALMFIVGVTFVLYARIGQAVLLLPVAALMLWGLFTLAIELKIYENLERLVSTENTRTAAWESMWNNAMQSPLLGVGFDDAGGSENSYLLGFASYGIVYFLLTIALLLGSMFICWRLLLGRRFVDTLDRGLIDLFISMNAMYFAGSFFEGYMLGRSNCSQVLLLFIAGMLPYLDHKIAEGREERATRVSDEHVEYEYEGQYEEDQGRNVHPTSH
ncbi:MAG: O-antigen ligase family protein [Phycisphaerales bacterium]|nr:O-antigen ligase family protein [Phycisphaerales bacterium]